jgi:hypothetical protein
MSTVHLFDAISLTLILLSAALFGIAAILRLSPFGAVTIGPARETARSLVGYAGLFLTLSLFALTYAWAVQ